MFAAVGKVAVAAVKAVHRAYTVANSLVVVGSPSDRQSAEFLRKARGLVRKLGVPTRGDGHNRTSLLLPNGSRIVGLPGKDATIRGFSAVNLLIIDEASRADDETYKALRPMLATVKGDCWLLSTPNGKQGFFYEAWAHEGDAWARFQVPATECPLISREWLEKERRRVDDASFRQEYMCEFTASEGQMFASELIEAAFVEGEVWTL